MLRFPNRFGHAITIIFVSGCPLPALICNDYVLTSSAVRFLSLGDAQASCVEAGMVADTVQQQSIQCLSDSVTTSGHGQKIVTGR